MAELGPAEIRNYLGFPWGVGARTSPMPLDGSRSSLGPKPSSRVGRRLETDDDDRLLTLSNGDVIRAQCVVLAGGVTYRLSGIESVDALIGHGVFYGAGAGEATAMAGLRVAVMGGGNSAGQAAAHFAAAGADVTVLIRGDSVEKSMSDYLVRQLEGTPNVFIRTQVSVVEALGEKTVPPLVLAGSRGQSGPPRN